MSLLDYLSEVRVIPEVEAAIMSLINSEKDCCVTFGGDCWYETKDGERVTFFEPSEEDSVDFNPDDDELIRRISGMPIFLLYFYRLSDRRWELLLDMDISNEKADIHDLSDYSLFRQSPYAPLFKEDFEDESIVTVSRYIGNDIDVASRLISYYIRYYDYESHIPDCIEP